MEEEMENEITSRNHPQLIKLQQDRELQKINGPTGQLETKEAQFEGFELESKKYFPEKILFPFFDDCKDIIYQPAIENGLEVEVQCRY